MEHGLQTGNLIVSSDGADIGRVKEVQSGYFKVDAPMSQDYWLSSAWVAAIDGAVVRLSLRKSEVSANELDDQGLAQSAEVAGEPTSTDDAPLAEPERREHEIAAQTDHVRLP